MTGYETRVSIYSGVPFRFDNYLLFQRVDEFLPMLESYNVNGAENYIIYNDFISDGGAVIVAVKQGADTLREFKERLKKYKEANFIIVKRFGLSSGTVSTDCYNINGAEVYENATNGAGGISFSIKYSIGKNHFANLLFSVPDASTVPSLKVKRGTLTTATKNAITGIKNKLQEVNKFGLFEITPRVNGVSGARFSDTTENIYYPAMYIEDANGKPNAFPEGMEFIAICGGLLTDPQQGFTTGAAFTFKRVIKTDEEIRGAVINYAGAQKAVERSSLGEFEYDFKPDFCAIIPAAFFGLSAGHFLPTSATEWVLKTGASYSWSTSYKIADGYNEITKIIKNAFGVNRAILQFYDTGRNFSEYQIEVGTPFQRVEIPRYEIFGRDYTDFNFCELHTIIDGAARRFQMLLEVCGKFIDITEDFSVPLAITTDSERVAQQKIAQKVSIIQGVGSAALGGVSAVAGLATGNIAAAAGGALSVVGAFGGVAQQLQNPVKPSVSSAGSGAGTTTIKYEGNGIYISFTRYQNAEEIKRDTETFGFNCNLQFEEITGGYDISEINSRCFMKVENAAFYTPQFLSVEGAEELRKKFAQGVRVYYSFSELANKEGL